ncbi:hypothetical protein V8C35DRAFT_9071 [Trichoderma chlorosporum]
MLTMNLAGAAPRLGLARNEPRSRIIAYWVLVLARNAKEHAGLFSVVCADNGRGLQDQRPHRQKQVHPSVSCVDGTSSNRPFLRLVQGPRLAWILAMLAGARGTKIKNCLALHPRRSAGEIWPTGGRYGVVDDCRTLSCSSARHRLFNMDGAFQTPSTDFNTVLYCTVLHSCQLPCLGLTVAQTLMALWLLHQMHRRLLGSRFTRFAASRPWPKRCRQVAPLQQPGSGSRAL